MSCPSSALIAVCLALATTFAVAGEPRYFAYVSGNTNTVECFPFDATAGTVGGMLGAVGTSNVGSPSGYLAWSPDRTKMYGLRSGNLVGAYSINPSTGALTALGSAVSSGGTGPTHLCVHPTGKWIYVANYTSGHVVAIPVKTDGSLDIPLTPVLAGVKAHMVLTNRAGTRLYVPCLGSDHIAIYQINQTTGVLTPNAIPTVAVPDSAGLANLPGPRHMAFNGAETRGYVINELESSMTTFTHNPATGALTSPVTVTTLPAGFVGTNTCAHVLVSPDGGTLYGSNRGHDSMVSFRITAGTGQLVVPPTWNTVAGEISHPRDFTLDPSGTVLLCANRDSDTVTVFRVTPSTGVLTRLGVKAVGDGPTFVGVMPNRSVLTSLAVTPSTHTVAAGTSYDFDVQGLDQFGDPFTTPAVTWTVSAGGGSITTAGSTRHPPLLDWQR
jgi:6-phosphogluconolactonase